MQELAMASKKGKLPMSRQGRRKISFLATVFLATLAVLGQPQKAFAQGPPVNTDTAFVAGLQGAALRSFLFSTRRHGLRQDGRRISDPLDQKVSVVGLPLILPYEVLKNRLVVIGGHSRSAQGIAAYARWQNPAEAFRHGVRRPVRRCQVSTLPKRQAGKNNPDHRLGSGEVPHRRRQ